MGQVGEKWKMLLSNLPTIDDETCDLSDLNPSQFPDYFWVIARTDFDPAMHICVNADTCGPDPMNCDLLACFHTEGESIQLAHVLTVKMGILHKSDRVTFEEARQLALSKPKIHGLALILLGSTRTIHWVR